jgi:formylmethanofuran dehydrogenase subunit B
MVAGLGAEVHGLRALMQLAAASHAVVDHAHGAAQAAVLTAMQDRGSFTTTLAEIRTRADLVLLVGPFDEAGFPRLAARLGLPGHDGRAVLALGHPGLAGVNAEAVPLQGDLYDSVATLNAAVAGRPVPQATPALQALAARLQAARYVAVVWAPGALPAPQPTLLVEGLHRLVKLLNRRTRAGALMLAGPDGALTAQQVMTWRSGLPLRSAFHPAGLHHEPHRYGLATLAARGAVDALLWVTAFDAAVLPPAEAAALPTVLLGHPGLAGHAAARAAEVFIATAVPGVHAGGHLTRTDVVVTVPLFPLVDSSLPDVATVARGIAQRLPARVDAPAEAGA